MTKKIIKIEYDPYGNYIGFAVSLDAGNSWQDLADTSELLKYQNQECVFSNCVEDIVSYINQYQNSNAEGLCIQFIGTESTNIRTAMRRDCVFSLLELMKISLFLSLLPTRRTRKQQRRGKYKLIE